jgi:hypothetical protein
MVTKHWVHKIKTIVCLSSVILGSLNLPAKAVPMAGWTELTEFATKSWFPEVYVPATTNSIQKELIFNAMENVSFLMIDSNYKEKYNRCVNKYATSRVTTTNAGINIEDVNILGPLQKAFYVHLPNQQKRRIFIDDFREEKNVHGFTTVATMNLNAANIPDDIHVGLNYAWLDKQSRTNETRNFLAGTFLHEFAHALGLSHPEVDSSFEKVVGNIVYENGWCIKRGTADKPPGSFNLTGDESDLYVD